MNPTTQIVCSLTLTLGVPIVLAGWELWRIGPTARRLPPGDEGPPEPTPLADAGVSPRIQKPLPSCLIPSLPPEVAAREREPA